MEQHWTYLEPKAQDQDLEQGDILLPNDRLNALFEQVHPHFCSPKYSAFMIVTQSCDLVRRKKECKADHINLAVIRPLLDVLPSFLRTICGTTTANIYKKEEKEEAQRFLERLFNQNEQSAGLFYLHPDHANVGIAQESVVLLRVAIAVRAHEHYETLVESRKGSLNPEFQCKLGWLMGNIYSRIGTKDWDEVLLKEMINKSLSEDTFVWAEDVLYTEAKEKDVCFEGLTRDEILAELEKCRRKPFKELLAEQVSLEARKAIDRWKSLFPEAFSANETEPPDSLVAELDRIPYTIGNRIKNNQVFKRAVDRSAR